MLIMSIKLLVSFSLGFVIITLVLMNRELIKNKWQQFLVWRQQKYVEDLQNNIVVTKRGLAHIQHTHNEQSRKLIKMQSAL